MQEQRRDFLKITAAGAAGLVLARADRAFAAWPGTGTLAINPNIDNMRVVSCYDTKMMKSTPTSMTFAVENAAVDSARVQANMDAMAMQLANQTTADAAWKAIFRSSKAWAATKVAIKVNTIEPKNQARIAVVQKFCSVLLGFGVLPANIVIYDGNSTYAKQMYTDYSPYFSLTDTTKIQAVVSNLNGSLGGTVSAPIPGGTSAACTADIANGAIDILINIANNKGHVYMGKATLSMKNHFGTFAPNHNNFPDYVFNINKSDAILGGTPVRQQLCFIDSLLANKASNTGTPEVMPCYLIMGVFGPAVDYLTVKKVREAVMGCTHDAATINSYLTTFGYATSDAVWVVVPPATVISGSDGGTGGDGSAGTGGTGGSGGAGGSGGTSGSGGVGTGGSSGSGGVAGGGTSGSGGARGGTSGSGGVGSGGSSGSGGVAGGGTSGSAGARGGATSRSGGVAGGGTTAAGGTTAGGGTTSGGGGAVGTGGTATSATAASGGSTATGGTSAGTGTTVSSVGGRVGSTGTTGTTGATVTGGKSGGGCSVAGVDRRATRWGAMLALGAVVAGKLRRLVSGSDGSS